MDCSKSLIEYTKEQNNYKSLEQVYFNKSDEVDTSHHYGQYDFVVSPSMINNDGWDEEILLKLLDYTKMGGFVIFATKLNLNYDDQYWPWIEKLQTE